MRYPEEFIGPMRQELTRLGVQETRTPEAVDAILGHNAGTVLMVINSMCGCAAGRARPGIALALKHAMVPDQVATVFAGGDLEATVHVREYLHDYPPSSTWEFWECVKLTHSFTMADSRLWRRSSGCDAH